MKKSNIVTIGLLALSLASCKKEHKHYPSLYANNPNYYIRQVDGNANGEDGYYPCSPYYPIWIYNSYFYSPVYGYGCRPGIVYSSVSRTTGRSSMHSSFGGRTTTSHGIGRGGFGRSASVSS